MKKYVITGNAESVHFLKWVKELIEYFDVYIVSSKNTHKDIKTIVAESKIFNLNLTITESGGNFGLFKKYFSVKKIIKQINPDFVNPHYITSHGFLIALIKKFSSFRFKLIQSAWGSDILISPFKNKAYYYVTKFSLNSADLITSDSQYMTGIIRNISNTKTTTFTFGIDKLPDIKLSNKIENLYYSNRILSENYNIKEIINFFSKILKEDPGAKLIISNDGSHRKELEKQVKNLGIENNVNFKDFISLSEQISYYEKSQFYISIPASDSTSVSLIEAMAFGCIPVVSDIPANREWIVDGVNGIFYTDKTDFSVIRETLKIKKSIFEKNRNIVRERAIFPESVQKFVKEIFKL